MIWFIIHYLIHSILIYKSKKIYTSDSFYLHCTSLSLFLLACFSLYLLHGSSTSMARLLAEKKKKATTYLTLIYNKTIAMPFCCYGWESIMHKYTWFCYAVYCLVLSIFQIVILLLWCTSRKYKDNNYPKGYTTRISNIFIDDFIH